ncbi:VirB4 family type IV secretion/conjugal transfer ATPase [Mesorhizobium sp. M4B.F.Ca.ET.215.01.1.1]|uniref:VirB4 family type IV secretion/conjugal transfer ATPase n=1 Tax=unclassified Mesorhizobium TaxID=325217 RepID=UPI000FE9A1E1|nr:MULTISPECIES: VirB4 family type IV secretion/conjugal transfer ATPase [unclassified Mesorhizobium]RWC82901.1 MAG: VirB4 family type IV secretion/conjugal transfer ATPase [Mesorhizobium sp.]TGQ05216.1 VirB4 family type IV secretion/conjugal transfer ATPase [Mesorhizobium sp. M4B.F.Ca.ET.215.01.1.1]TGQ30522.1 VirB4 family type IV secretion/conjugal transfer ATPase [Mesorhizobium sp. M00.F.Ca.ET.220.01.1.1]TGQ97762.1 VirB4 family type IV secretion/conjugal transfer ATPase [Mesorhizobium sp. M4B
MLKVVREELGFGKVAHNERPMSTHIPYLRHVSDTVIGLENGSLLSVIKLDGLFFQTEDQAELNMRSVVQNTMIRALGSSRFSLWSTVIRREVETEIGGAFDEPFCELLNRRYMDQLREKRMFTNEIYLTIVRSGMRGALGIGDSVKKLLDRANREVRNQQTREDVTELEELISNITRELQKYGARALGIAYRDKEPYSEPCEFFNTILTCGVPRKMRLPRMGIRNFVGTSRLHFSKRTMQAQAAVDEDSRFGALLSVKEYPPFTGPGMLDGLLQVNHEFILTQSFTIADKPIAQERITRLQRQIQASDEAGSSVEKDIDYALNSLMNQEAVFGFHHLTLLCLSRDLKGVSQSVSELGACLTDMNINWLREDVNLEAGFWAQLPGNRSYIARKAMLSSANFSGLSSMHNFATGKIDGTHWGLPITILETTSQTPYWFNFHQRDIGHFLVTGPTGSGKTVALTFLLAQAMRVNPTPKAVFFDKDRGAEIFVRAIGGSYEVLSPETTTGFNPLQLENTGPNREFLMRLLKAMLRSSDRRDFTQEDEDTLEKALTRLMQEPAAERNLPNLSGLLVGRSRADANDLHSRLRPWIDGEKAWLFNAQHDVLSFSGHSVFGFDMTSILGNEELRTPALMYLYHRLDELLNGDPVMFFMDEGWQLLKDETFSNFIVDKMKTIRKLNGIVGFGTQSAADIAKAKASHTLIEQSATNIHFPNPRADEESYIKRFGLTVKEFNFIKNTPPEKRTFLVKHGNDSVIARLDLSSMPDMVKVLSGRKKTIEECAALREKYGDEPENWLAEFCGWEKGQ